MLAEPWKRILGKRGALPALPEVLLRLQAGLYELNLDIDELCKELQRDPALVAEIVKVINSPLFGMPRRIVSLRQAVVMLGLRRVRAVILSQSLRQSLSTYQSPGFALTAWWDRSLLNAVFAAMLAQRSAVELVEEAYLAGLIADLGVLILARYEPRYEQILRKFGSGSGEELSKQSRRELGFDHAELAAEVCAGWKLPAMVVQAIRRHHDRTQLQEPGLSLLSRSICLACLLTDCVVTKDQQLMDLTADCCEHCQAVSRQELGRLMKTGLDRYSSLAGPMGCGSLAGIRLPSSAASA